MTLPRPGRHLLHLLLLGTALSALSAQSPVSGRYVLDRWNTESGLPQNGVTTILQTRDGRLWVGTLGGVARFDGTAFFSITTGDRLGLPNDRITALAEDRLGRIWIGTEDGLSRYERGTITTFTTADGLPNNNVNALAAHPDGSLWVATVAGGLARLDSAGVRVVVSPRTTFKNLAAQLLVGADSVVWVSAASGVWRVNSRTLAITLVREGDRAPRMAADRQDGVWMTVDSTLLHYGTAGAREYPLPGSALGITPIRSLAVDSEGALWLGGGGAIVRARVDSGVWEPIPLGEPGAATALVADREGSIWIGNRFLGLARVRPALFRSFVSGDGDNFVTVFADSRGRVWGGARCHAVAVIEREAVRVLTKKEQPQCVAAFAEDTSGAIWMGGSGLVRWRNSANVSFLGDRNAPRGTVRSLFVDRGGTLWIGGAGGLLSWDGREFRVHMPPANGELQQVRAIYEARDGTLWLGAFGLLRYARGEITRFTMEDGLPHNNVRAIHEDSSGALWIATYGGGLGRLANGEFKTFTTGDGLLDNFLSSVHEDAAGNLWISANRGVFRVSRRELEERAAGRVARVRAIAYGRADGMLSAETNGGFHPSYARTADGRLWYPTLVGVAMIDPAKAVSAVPPAVTLERVLVNGRLHEPTDGLSIGPGASDVELAYSGLSLTAPNAVTFRYRLEGWDDDWIDAGTRRSAFYSRLAPGDYRFRIMAANRDGIWSAETTPLAFVVRPEFWQTWWFRTLGLLAIAAVPLARDRRQRRRQRELTRLVEEKTSEIRQQNDEIVQQAKALEQQNAILAENVRLKDDVERIARHDLRTPLSSIISLAQIVREDPGLESQHGASLKLIEQAGYRVLNMANLTLDLYKMEQRTYHLSPKAVDIRAVAERVLVELQALMRTREVACAISVEGFGEDARPLVHGDGLLSHSMLSNLVKNAIEASPPGGRVSITIASGAFVSIRIHNAGVIPAAIRDRFFEKYASAGKKGGMGLGAYSARLMAETQGGRIAVQSSERNGTTIIVELLPPEPTDVREWTSLEIDTAMGGGGGLAAPVSSPPRRLLVVDDDEGNRAILRRFLSHPQWTVDEAENGPLALRKLADEPYDFVFVDIEMPVMDGFEVVKHLRELGEHRADGRPRPVIVALSSHDDPGTKSRALACGFDHYFTKPVSRRAITEIIAGEPSEETAALDEDVRTLLPMFLAKKAAEITELGLALSRQDGESLRRTSHRLRGSFSLYGFREAATLCGEIEELARSNQLAGVGERLSVLHGVLRRADAGFSKLANREKMTQ